MITFANPAFLLLIPCFILYFALTGRALRSRLPVFIRILAAVLMTAALAGAAIRTDAEKTVTIFAIDVSASMNASKGAHTDASGTDVQNTVLEFLNTTVAGMDKDDAYGVLLFAERGFAAIIPAAARDADDADTEIRLSNIFDTRIPDSRTDIAEGLRLSQTLIPEKSIKKITLISDGLENAGDALTAARLLSRNGIVVDTLPAAPVLDAEVQLNEIAAPLYARAGSVSELKITGWSAGDNPGRLLVYRNGELIADDDVRMHKGENRFVVADQLPADFGGGVIYRAEILPADDTYADNNTVYSYGYVEGAPRILAVGTKGSETEIVRLLRMSGAVVDVRSPAELIIPTDGLSMYDTVLLANIAYDDMPEGFADALEAYVRDLGGGLIVSGGDNSFGPGGYRDTVLDRILPVESRLSDEQDSPDIGLTIVLDRSGSMTTGNYGVSKLEMAKEAVIRSVETMSDSDSIGVLAFDDMFHWASEYRSIGGYKDEIIKNTAAISPGGGTSILPALREAYRELALKDAKIKHIVLLTDGQAERYGYDGLIEAMRRDKITLTTIAVGSDSDTELLEWLAERGGGRYYFTNEFTDLPKIFTKETAMAGRRYINNELFYPEQGTAYTNASEILSGMAGVPVLAGYVSSTAKPRADALLLSGRGEPVLAAWQYGLGRAVAWTSDLDGGWSAEWLRNDGSAAVLRDMVAWTFKPHAESGLSLSCSVVGGSARLSLRLAGEGGLDDGIESVTGIVSAPGKANAEIVFDAIAPGEYAGVYENAEQGAYTLNLTVTGTKGSNTFIEGFSLPYPEELDMRYSERGADLLRRIAEATGGRVLTALPKSNAEADSDAVGSGITEAVHAAYDDKSIGDLLIIVSLLLFLTDVLIRRFPLKRLARAEAVKKTKRPAAPAVPESVAQSTTAALIMQKKKRMK